MSEDILKLCLSSVFIRALLNEIDDVETKELKQTLKKLDKHLRFVLTRRFVHRSPEEATIRLLATKAWDEAKGGIQTLPANELYVSYVTYRIYDEYQALYKTHSVVKEKLFKLLYEEQRKGMSLKFRKSSNDIAKKCVQAINKVVYQYQKERL